MDDFDIYADLPDVLWLKQEYEADVEIKKEELPTSEKDVTELKTKFLKLEKVHKLVLSHYSSLWKTAKQERKRMERQIADLRSQLDNFAFKRNQRQRPMPSQAPVQPLNVPPPVVFPPPNFNHPPPLMSQPPFSEQQNTIHLYNYPPPFIPSAVATKQQWSQQEVKSEEHFVDNLAGPLNVITPENSHSSDESEDDVVKSDYRSTVYGERLRKKLLEDKRNEKRQKQEALNEQQVNENELKPQKIKSENVDKIGKENDLKDENTASINKQTDLKTVKKENNDKIPNEIKMQNVQESYKVDKELKSQNGTNDKDNVKSGSDIEIKTEVTSTINNKCNVNERRTNTDSKTRSEIQLNERRPNQELIIERRRDMERKREDESRMRQEREREGRRKEEESEKAKREEQIRKRRREEEIENRRKDQEIERRKKEELDKRRREEINKRRKEEEVERRKRKEEENERKKRNVIDRIKKERELKILKEKEIEEKRREEEQHLKKLKEIEKRELEELIKERKRIEKEMNAMKDEETEEVKPEPLKSKLPREQSIGKNSTESSEQRKENFKEKKQSQENRSDHRRNDDSKVDGRSTRNNSSHAKNPNQRINDSRKNDHHEYPSSKCDRGQDNHIRYDKYKHSDLRSRRDQPERDRERRKSSSRNKSRNRRSPTVHRAEEDKRNYSPKRIKLQERDMDLRDKLKNPETVRKDKIQVRSPKRRRPTKSDEKSPQNNKKRRISPEKHLDCNIKLNNIAVQKTNGPPSSILDESNTRDNHTISSNCTKNIIDSALSNENTSNHSVDNKFGPVAKVTSVEEKLNEENENLTESSAIAQDTYSNKLTGCRKTLQENCEKDNQVMDLKKDQCKIVNTLTDEAKNIEHAKKMKTLISELFDESQETPVSTPAKLENVRNLYESLDETILSQLEEGEITDSDQSTGSENLISKSASSLSTKEPIKTMNLCEEKKFESEVKDSILYNMLSQNKNNSSKENSMNEFHKETSHKKEAVHKDSEQSESCNEISNLTDSTSSSQITNKKLRGSKSSETLESKKAKKNLLSNVKEHKTEGNDTTNTITERVIESTDNKTNDSVEGKKNNSENFTSCTSIPAISNILVEQPVQNFLKINNSENKIDIQEKLNIKRAEHHSEASSTKNACVKENVEVNSQPIVELEIPRQDDAAKSSVKTSQTKVSTTAVRKVIVVRRRKRPVQLSDSPPVVVIDNPNKTN